jgi:hypothetical protein
MNRIEQFNSLPEKTQNWFLMLPEMILAYAQNTQNQEPNPEDLLGIFVVWLDDAPKTPEV